MLEVLLSCYMLNTITLSLHYICFHSHFFWTFQCSLLYDLSHVEYSPFVYTEFLYGEYCCIFLWFIIVHFDIFCLENYCWIQQRLVMLLHHCCSCPSLSTDRFQEIFLIILRNFGHKCFVCLLVYLYSASSKYNVSFYCACSVMLLHAVWFHVLPTFCQWMLCYRSLFGCVQPSSLNALQAIQQLLIIVVPGRSIFWLLLVMFLLFGCEQWLKMFFLFPIPLHEIPTLLLLDGPHYNSVWWNCFHPLWPVLVPIPIFKYAFYILQHNYLSKQKPVTSSGVQYLVLHFCCI